MLCTATLPRWKPILPLVLPQRWPTRPPPRLCGVPASCRASSQSICSMAPIPAVRQKRSKELSTSCQAVSRLGTSASDEGVVVVVMALLSFADSTPRAYRLKVGNASFPNSTATGAIPRVLPIHPYDLDAVYRGPLSSSTRWLVLEIL